MNECIYKDVSYLLKRSERKTLSIYVETNGQVRVLAPHKIGHNHIENIIELKRYWIHKSLAELRELNKTKVKRDVTDGEGYLFMGKNYRLKIASDQKQPLTVSDGYFILDSKYTFNARLNFIKFYKEQGIAYLKTRLQIYTKKLGVSTKPIRILELKNRWASCSDKSLNFHWKLMLAPATIIDYVLVHELAHLIEKKHNRNFWSIVESIMSDYADRKEWLRVNGANLDI